MLVLVFTTWRKGRSLVTAQLEAGALPVDVFLGSASKVARAPGLAVYLTSSAQGVPPALLHNLKHNHVLHQRVFLLTVETALTPTVDVERRVELTEIGSGLARVKLRYGFMQEPDVPAGLAHLEDLGERIDPLTTSYFLSRQIVIPTRRKGMSLWREHLFAAMSRNAATPMTTFNLPVNRVIELGSQVEI